MQARTILLSGVVLGSSVLALWAWQTKLDALFFGSVTVGAFAVVAGLQAEHVLPPFRPAVWALAVGGVLLVGAAVLSTSSCTTSWSVSVEGGTSDSTPAETVCTHAGLPPAVAKGALVAGLLAFGIGVVGGARRTVP